MAGTNVWMARGLAPLVVLSSAIAACGVDERDTQPSMTFAPNEAAGGAGSGTTGMLATVPGSGGNTGGSAATPPAQPAPPDQLDLLIMIDNSISMADKQEILRLTVSDLMSRLVNPICLDEAGNEHPAPPPGAGCPAGQRRQFEPIADIHVGLISSSLGDAGANVACASDAANARYIPDRVDMAHLVGSLERGGALADDQAFLSWSTGSDLEQFNTAFRDMVSAVGESGCGWEASLESWYRFLVDPRPYQSLVKGACAAGATTINCVAPSTDESGQPLIDQAVLAQRAAFLRPNSLVAVVMLTDENDCSIEPVGQNWVMAAIDDANPMVRGTAACVNPNDPCCRSCGTAAPAGCAEDPSCATGVTPNRLAAEADGQNLRCFDQKRRFGYDFLYPTQRYVNALTQRELCLDHSDTSPQNCPSPLVPNPLFAGGRAPERVLLAGIVGVPWQSLASGADATGRALSDPGRQLRFKSSSELTSADWARIIGTPGTPGQLASGGMPAIPAVAPSPPSEPSMVESPAPRDNISPGNPVNGRDYDTTNGSFAPDDLQYACIFPLPTPRDCTQLDPNTTACDCYQGQTDRPLCEATPGNGSPGTTQYWAKAYPATRQLRVLRDLGQRSIVSSICARNTSDLDRPDFGYRPAVAAILERLQRP